MGGLSSGQLPERSGQLPKRSGQLPERSGQLPDLTLPSPASFPFIEA